MIKNCWDHLLKLGRRRLGRRGAMLTILAATYVIVGLGVLIRPVVPSQGSFVLLVPQELLCAAWALSGLVAGIAAWSKRGDTIGWLALYIVPSIYVLSYSGAWVLWLMTAHVLPVVAAGIDYFAGPHFDPAWWLIEPPYGDPIAWYNAVLRVPYIAIVLVCSGWRERSPRP